MKAARSLQGFSGRKIGWLLVCSVLTLVAVGGARAANKQVHLPDGIPSGYVAETRGTVKWIFQKSTRSQMQELSELQSTAWKRIRSELGGSIDPNIEIRIAINPEQMQALAPKKARLPSYATGVAFPKLGLILLTLTAPDSWEPVAIESVLVHELSHLALHRAVDGAKVPRWFSEGVAIYHAQEQSFARTKTLWEGSLQSRLIPLERLSEAFPSRRHQVNLAYAESADFVGFLLEGEDNHYRFAQLIKSLRQGKSFSEAISSAYHLPLGYLEREWIKSLRQRFGRWPLLLTGMGTLWVVACILLLAAYIQMKRKHKATLKRWAFEEASVAQVHRLAASSADPLKRFQSPDRVSEANTPDRTSIPTIEYDGRNHTVH